MTSHADRFREEAASTLRGNGRSNENRDKQSGVRMVQWSDGSDAGLKTRVKTSRNSRKALTVLHAERADNPERKERHDEHVQVSRVRVAPQIPPVVRPKVNHDRST